LKIKAEFVNLILKFFVDIVQAKFVKLFKILGLYYIVHEQLYLKLNVIQWGSLTGITLKPKETDSIYKLIPLPETFFA
jgi:hypothetical protein